jgi:hypothetical protein
MMWPTRADQDAGLDQHDRVRAHQVLQSCLAPMAATLTEHLREVMRGVDALDQLEAPEVVASVVHHWLSTESQAPQVS